MKNSKPIAIIGWIFFALVFMTNLWFHEMWFDELQAWSLTRYSSGISGLFASGEGHPVLWYLILWPLTSLTSNPEAMKFATGLLGIGSLGLLWTQSPFSVIEKVLISLSYQVGFNLLVLSRSYSVGVFLAFLFAAGHPQYKERPWLAWLILSLLANTHFFFSVVSFCLALIWLNGVCAPKRYLNGISLYVAGLSYCAYCVAGQGSTRELHGSSLLDAINTFGFGILSISNPLKIYYWNTRGAVFTGVLLTVFFICALLEMFRTQRFALSLLLLQQAFFIIFFTFVHSGQSWHVGVFFVSMLSTVWLLRMQNINFLRSQVLLALLFVQAIFVAKFMIASKIIPVASNRTTGRLIHQLGIQDSFIIGYPQFPTTAICAYLDRPLYFAEKKGPLPYCDWNGPWIGMDQLISTIQTELEATEEAIYLVLPTGEGDVFLNQIAGSHIVSEKIGFTTGSMVEHYVIFRLDFRPDTK